MIRIHTAATLAAAFQSRYPTAATDRLASLDAAAELDSVEAMAVRGFASVSSKLVWVRATSHFFVNGEFVSDGDYVELEGSEAHALLRREQALPATAEEAAAAAGKGKGK